jgi:hypothetical protein
MIDGMAQLSEVTLATTNTRQVHMISRISHRLG